MSRKKEERLRRKREKERWKEKLKKGRRKGTIVDAIRHGKEKEERRKYPINQVVK